jgi:CubicO group peptidase (beta-lactamase class C family)
MKNSLLLLLCLFFTMSISKKAIAQNPESDFDTLFTTRFPSDGPGAVVLVAKSGEIIYEKAFGMANLELNVPMHTNAVFRIGSNTKQFTAAAILKLAEEGKLSLEDDITKFVPDYPSKGKRITIKQLLGHTSGIKDYTGIPAFRDIKRKDLSPKDLVDLFKEQPMDFEPGQDFRYDNSGYVLLGYIIEQVTGKSYGQYIAENFFQTLGMKNSYYDDAVTIIPGRIPGYKKVDGHYLNADYLSMTLPYSAGSLLSTAEDFLTWYEAVMSGKAINRASVREAQISVILPNGRPTGFGYGWEMGNVQGSPSVKHYGVVNGFVTYATYLPQEKIFVAILSNSEAAGDLDMPASEIAAVVLGKPYLCSEQHLSAEQLSAYTGTYNTRFDGKKLIGEQDGSLEYYSKGGGKTRLISCGRDLFRLENSLSTLEFQKNKGRVSGYLLRTTGLPVEAVAAGEPVSPLHPIYLTADALEKYTGKYAFNAHDVFQVIREGDKLYGQLGHDRKEIIPYDTDKFFARYIDALLIFQQDAGGRVTGLTKIQNSEMSANKVE